MKRIPARISWPLAIVALLLANISIAVGTLIVANWNGGVQVVPDYYSEAVAWDSLSAIQNSSTALGWTTQLTTDKASGTIRVDILGVDGNGIAGLTGKLGLTRPHLSKSLSSGTLVALDEAGSYRVSGLDLSGSGIHDITIQATVGDSTYVVRQRLDIP